MEHPLNTILGTILLLLTACTTTAPNSIDFTTKESTDSSASITSGASNIWYILGACGTDAHVVAIDGEVLQQFTEEKTSPIGLPYNPDFDYSLKVSSGEHEIIIALQKCHLVLYQLGGCTLESFGRCNVTVEGNHSYQIKGVGCTTEKGIKVIDLETNLVVKECSEFDKTTSPWIHKGLQDFLAKPEHNMPLNSDSSLKKVSPD